MVLLKWFSVRTFLLQIPGVTLKIHWDLNETRDDHEAQLACNLNTQKCAATASISFSTLVSRVTVVAIVA